MGRRKYQPSFVRPTGREAMSMSVLRQPLLSPNDPTIVAIASDRPLREAKVPVINLDDVDGIVDSLIRHAAPLDAALAVTV